ncbi:MULTISPECIES: hypothetical protein [unclassified Sulfitobacter]|uniref:hypothetical protein n=1 Tax=unclassified Sulfitobacter TaxID=196795 RepID=UPI000B0BFAB9|nr:MULTISPECIES: hypothetical protein [unclassified Sulfitobacter]
MDTRVKNIKRITSIAELDGYEAQAKKRGLLPEEMRALHEKRAELTPQKRRRK